MPLIIGQAKLSSFGLLTSIAKYTPISDDDHACTSTYML